MTKVDDVELLKEYFDIKKNVKNYLDKLEKLETITADALKSTKYFSEYNNAEIKPPTIEKNDNISKKVFYKAIINDNSSEALEKIKASTKKAKEEIEKYNSYATKTGNLSEKIRKIKKLIENTLKPGDVTPEDITNMSKILSTIFQIKYRKGKGFIYSKDNWGKRTNTLNAEDNDKNYTTCANTTSLILQSLGLLNKDEYLKPGTTKIPQTMKSAGFNNVLAKKDEDKTMNEILNENKLKPGDVIIWKKHINIYKGKNKDGEDEWFDSGRSAPGFLPDKEEKTGIIKTIGPFTTKQLQQSEKENNRSFNILNDKPIAIIRKQKQIIRPLKPNEK